MASPATLAVIDVYLPRLKNRAVLEKAIIQGAASRDFFGTAFGQSGENFAGFKFGDNNVQLDDMLLLIEAEAANAYVRHYGGAHG
jgi:hypothetical protein